MSINILILGKNTFLDRSVYSFLTESGFNVVLDNSASVGVSYTIDTIKPNVLIIISYDSSSVDLANSLKDQYNAQAIIILSLHNEKDEFYSTINIDMEGYLSILSPPDEIIEDIKAVSNGEKRVSRKLMSSLINTLKKDLKSSGFNLNNLNITSRELDILYLMAKGKTNKEIGRELNISPNTVKYFISHLFVKFSATSRADVVYKGYSILRRNKFNNM